MALIGFDLDNTIICYNQLFALTVQQFGLLPQPVPTSKEAIRNQLRDSPQGELVWRDLQALVYGKQIMLADPFPDVVNVMRWLLQADYELVIISHKSEWPASEKYHINLHKAATRWIEEKLNSQLDGYFCAGTNLHYCASRQHKLATIGAYTPQWFMDDLVEVLSDSAFPATVRRLLFVPDGNAEQSPLWSVITDWTELFPLIRTI